MSNLDDLLGMDSDEECDTSQAAGDDTFVTARNDMTLNRSAGVDDSFVTTRESNESMRELLEEEGREEERSRSTSADRTINDDEQKDIEEQLAAIEAQKAALMAKLAKKTPTQKTPSSQKATPTQKGVSASVTPTTSQPKKVEEKKAQPKVVPLDFLSRQKKKDKAGDKIQLRDDDESDSDDEMNENKKHLSEAGREMRRQLSRQEREPQSVSSFCSSTKSARAPPSAAASFQAAAKPSKIQPPKPRPSGLMEPSHKRVSPVPPVTASSPATAAASAYDTFFALKIKNPKVSSATFSTFCEGQQKVRVSDLRPGSGPSGNWVTMGVIVEKSEMRKSGNGNEYVIWKVHDLKNCQDHPAKVLLFGEACKTHWKLQVSSVVALMSPQYGEPGEKDKGVTLKAMKAAQIVEMGFSQDYGICKGTKADSQKCSNFVNVSLSEFCVYHVMSQARQLSSLRGAFSATSMPARKTQNAHTAVPKFTVKRSQPLPSVQLNESGTMRAASGATQVRRATEGRETTREEEAEKLGAILSTRAHMFGARNLRTLAERGVEEHKNRVAPISSMIDFMKERKEEEDSAARERARLDEERGPRIGGGGVISLSSPRGGGRGDPEAARQRAIEILRRKKEEKARASAAGGAGSTAAVTPSRKRPSDASSTPDSKRTRLGEVNKEDLLKLLGKRGKHAAEADKEEVAQEQRYLNVLEQKEKVETFMTSTMEVKNCKVCSCKECDYTAQSQSDLCKGKGHTVTWGKAEKRFFKCKGCSKKTIAFSRIPTKPCKHCDSIDWERVAMKEERKIRLDNERLEVRGEERTFVNI